jgi:hypothetical protein
MYKIPRNAKRYSSKATQNIAIDVMYDNIECNISFIDSTTGVYLNIIIK